MVFNFGFAWSVLEERGWIDKWLLFGFSIRAVWNELIVLMCMLGCNCILNL